MWGPGIVCLNQYLNYVFPEHYVLMAAVVSPPSRVAANKTTASKTTAVFHETLTRRYPQSFYCISER